MRPSLLACAALAAASSLVACTSSDSGGQPPSDDAGLTFTEDGATPGFDATLPGDAGTDATADTSKPPAGDSGSDVVTMDAADGATHPDAGTDASVDGGADAGLDTGTDTGTDASLDAGVDAADAAAGWSMIGVNDAAPVDAGFPQLSVLEWMTTGSINNQRGESAAAIPGGGFVWNAEYEEAIGGDYPPRWNGWTSKGANDIFIANMNGAIPGDWWGQSFGSDGINDQDLCEKGTLAVMPGGDILFTGEHAGTIPIGTQSLPSNGNYDVFLGRMANAAGSGISASAQAVSFGGTDSDEPRTIAVSPDGKWVAIGGFFQSPTMTVPGVAAALNHANDSATDDGGDVGYPYNWDAWVAVGSTTLGTFTYAAAWGSAGVEDMVTALGFDANDNLFIGGIVGAAATLPGGASVGGVGAQDAFVFQLAFASGTSTWSPGWSATIGTAGPDDFVQGIAADSANNVWVTGSYDGVLNLAGQLFPAPASGTAGFLVRYDPAGTGQFASSSTGSGQIIPVALAIDPQNGDVYVAGNLNGSPSWGGPSLVGVTQPDGALLRFSSAGTLLAQSAVTGTGTQDFESMAVDVNHTVGIAGFIDQPTDFGDGVLSPWYGGWDAFFATYHY